MRAILSAIFVLVLAGCSISKVTSDRQLTEGERRWMVEQRIPMRLEVLVVVGDQYQSSSNLMKNLQKTELFGSVVLVSRRADSGLVVQVRSSGGVMRCGNPALFAKATLGLWRDKVDYSYRYDFDLVSVQTGKQVRFEKTYTGSYRIGFWPAKDDAFLDLFKFDLAHMRLKIEALTQP